MPLTQNNQGVTTNSLFLKLSYGFWFQYDGYIAKEETLAPYEVHNIEFNIPIFYRTKEQGLFFITPLTLRSHPKPSPFYESRPTTFVVQGGLRYNLTIMSKTKVDARVTIGSRYRNSIANENSYESTVSVNGRLEVESHINRNFSLNFAVIADNYGKEEFSEETYAQDYLEIGITYTP